MTPRSSAIERGLALTSVLAAAVLALMALVVHRVNEDALDAGKRSIRSIEVMSTLDKLALALRDVDVAGRDIVNGRAREGGDIERFDAARFQARLNLAALGPLTSDEPAQSERLSRLQPLVGRKFARGVHAYDVPSPGSRDQIDALVGAMHDAENHRLDDYRQTQASASERSTAIMVGALGLVTLLSLVFWLLLKIEFGARRALEKRLIESATIDELTGTANRSEFDRRLVQEWTFKGRYATALSLLMIDVDQLKAINEQWGAVAGDQVLREVARRLASRLRRSELLARSGGDEFAVIVPQYRSEALALAEQLRERIVEAPFYVEGIDRPAPVAVTVSIGLAESSDVDSPRGLLAAAEEAMYSAKGKGRNRVEPFQPNPTSYGMRMTAATAPQTTTLTAPTTRQSRVG